MSYIKSLLVRFVALLAMVLVWLFTLESGVRGSDAGVKFCCALAAVVVGFLLRRCSKPYIGMLGHYIMLGALISLPTSAAIVLFPLFEGMDSFFGYFIAWIIMTLTGCAGVGACIGGIKFFFRSLLDADFYQMLLCVMIGVSGISLFIDTFTAAQEVDELLAFLVFIPAFGGGAFGGCVSKAPEKDSVSDGQGNHLYVISRISSNRIVASDGYSYWKRPDGNYERM